MLKLTLVDQAQIRIRSIPSSLQLKQLRLSEVSPGLWRSLKLV
jgi:hypothetical protein